jgi:hypothetical protein
MANVEEGGMAPREVVGGTDSERVVLNGHMETAKWNHLTAIGDVQIV